MQKLTKKSILLIGIILVLSFSSCKKNEKTDDNSNNNVYNINYILNDGTLSDDAITTYNNTVDTNLPIPTRSGYDFINWYNNPDFTGEPIEIINKGETGDKTFYAKWAANYEIYKPKWDLNTLGFDGNGMEIVIKVSPKKDYDPFDEGYTKEDKILRKKQIDLVQKAYNVKITYSNWDNESPWGPDRVQFIKDRYNDGEFQKKGVYILNIQSQWIPTLVKGNCLAELYKSESNTGVFRNVQFDGKYYEQDSSVIECCSVRRINYGYTSEIVRSDYFLYYNATLASSIGMEDPAELWFKGEWTWSKFDNFVREAQTKLGENQYSIDCSYGDFSIGTIAAEGHQLTNTKSGMTLIAKSHVSSVFERMKDYYQSGIWDNGHGVQDVSRNFLAGNTIFHSGNLWFLKDSTRFNPELVNFEIGIVPYPSSDSDNVMTPITKPYSYLDSEGNTIEVNEPIITRTNEILRDSSGNPIYGIDLSQSNYRSPYTGINCYSIMNYDYPANDVNPTVLFAILHDMLEGVGKDPYNPSNITRDEEYYKYLNTKLDYSIDINVVKSVQSKEHMYYELIEVLSMNVANSYSWSGGHVSYWMTASEIMTSQDPPATILKSVEKFYQAVLEELGY